MIRLEYDAQLPMLACVGQDGDDVAVVVNQYAQMLLDFPARKELFNTLMRELERRPGGQVNIVVRGLAGPNVVIRLDDLRQRRAIAAKFAEGFALDLGADHGLDSIFAERSAAGDLPRHRPATAISHLRHETRR